MSFDTLTHLDFIESEAQRQAMVQRARACGVDGWVIAATTPSNWRRVLDVAKSTKGTPLLGVHPWWAHQFHESEVIRLLQSIQPLGISGIGEVGLDYVRATTPEQRHHQQRIFEVQLVYAREHNLPVAIHCVRAFHDLFRILKQHPLDQNGGLLHGWGASPETVKPALAAGLHLSFGPTVMLHYFKKARQSVGLIPLDRLCIESDCPEHPLDGKDAGEPADIVHVAQSIAELRTETPQQLFDACGQNAKRLWRVGS